MFLVAATLLVVAAKSMKKWSQQRRSCYVGEEMNGVALDEVEEEPSEAQLRDVIIDGDLDIVEMRQLSVVRKRGVVVCTLHFVQV